MPLTTPQHEEIAGLAQRGRMGFLNELADRWGVQYLEVARSYADAQRAFNSPSSTPAPSKPAAPAPAAEPALETPQEVQHEMTKGTPNPNHPGDAELIRMVAELREQGVVNLTKALADKLKVPHGTARKWHYKAQGSSPSSPNPPVPGFACETCRDSGYVEGGDAGVACECPIGRRIDGQMQAALAEPGAVAPVPGNVPLVDAPTDSTAAVAQGGMLMDVPQPNIWMTGTAGPVMLNPLADVTASPLPSGTYPHTDIPTADQAEAFSTGFVLGNETGRVLSAMDQITAMKQRIAELQAEASGREAALQITDADRTRLTEHVAQLKDALHDVDMANANVASLMAENEQLQVELKAAIQTIEQAARDDAQQGSVTYLVVDNDPGSKPDVHAAPDGYALAPGDEWARLIMLAGRRRYDIWHCVETIALPGGNVVCMLRPGAAETAEEVA